MTQPPRHDTEREVIVTDGNSGAGVIIGVVLAVLAILLVVWLLFGMGEGDGGEADVVPDDVNVTVDVEEPTGGNGEG